MTAPAPVSLDSLRSDIAAFADPSVAIRATKVDDLTYDLSWEQAGQERTARFRFEAEGSIPVSVTIGDTATTYMSFLAGSDMADLRALAKNINYVLPEISPYVPLPVSTVDGVSVGSEDADDAVVSRAVPSSDGRTALIFVTAEPGTGKTSLLRMLVRRKATEYLQGLSETLWLYVDAQGKRLAQLDQAIAAELDEVRARFPYHAVAPLVRCGALIIVVDGFDELIGNVGSYDEAFGSLADFIAELDGQGCLVAAARSAYYEQEFLTREDVFTRTKPDMWELVGVKLADWTVDTRDTYVRRFSAQKGQADRGDSLVSEVASALSAAEVSDVSRKPLFVARTADFLLDGDLPSGTTLLDRLIEAYIHREVTQKLKSASGAPLLTPADYRTLLEDISAEMWRQETRELTQGSVRDLAEVVGEVLEWSTDTIREVLNRLPTSALLGAGSVGSVAFEHDIFYAYFVATPLGRPWRDRDIAGLGRLLRRGRLPEDAAWLAARIASSTPTQALLDDLARTLSTVRGDQEQVRRNAGSLAAGLLRDRHVADLRLDGLAFGDVSLGQLVLTRSQLVGCTLNGTDLTETRIEGSVAQDSYFDRVIVTLGSTLLEIDGSAVEDFLGLELRDVERSRVVFSPAEIRGALQECGLPAAAATRTLRPVDEQVVGLLDRLCRLFVKTNSVTEEDSNEMVSIARDPSWRTLRQSLIESKVVSRQTRPASGQKVFLRRHQRPQDIMAGVDADADVPEPVALLWRTLEARFPAGGH